MLCVTSFHSGPSGQQVSPRPVRAGERCVFTLAFERLSPRVQEHLQEGTSPLNRRERKEFVRDVVQPMVDKVSRPQREFISVAEELDRKYPVALQDLCIKGQPLSRCYDSLFQQMEHRVENNNRGQTASPAEQAKKKKEPTAPAAMGVRIGSRFKNLALTAIQRRWNS